MMAFLAASVVAAAPAWKVTFSTSSGSDHGNGVTVATSDVTWVVTPEEVTMTAEGTRKGKPVKSAVVKPKPTPPAVRDAIAALLPKLPATDASFSTSQYVDDEGWNSEALAVERDGKTVRFALVQGRGAPLPPELVELKKLIAQALR